MQTARLSGGSSRLIDFDQETGGGGGGLLIRHRLMTITTAAITARIASVVMVCSLVVSLCAGP
jgi:hypothetical protein